MRKTILERYQRLPDGRYVIDINAGKTSDLYNNYDKYAPYVRKEDQDLVDYITDSAQELGNAEFFIQFRLREPADSELRVRIAKSIKNYFLYLRTVEMHELGRMMRTSLIVLAVGIAILLLSIWVNSNITGKPSVLHMVFAEGLTVASWVALWQALATFLIHWAPISKKIILYKRIAKTDVQFA